MIKRYRIKRRFGFSRRVGVRVQLDGIRDGFILALESDLPNTIEAIRWLGCSCLYSPSHFLSLVATIPMDTKFLYFLVPAYIKIFTILHS